MSLLIISLLVVGAGLVAAKVYFQHKQTEIAEKQETEKSHEQIVAERLQEIAKFETEVVESKADIVADPVVIEEKKPKANKHKKYYKPKKQQPKIKAK